MIRIIGRRSSLFTRPVLMFAETLAQPVELAPLRDLAADDPQHYGGNPALCVPVLERASGPLFGALNICRELADRADELAAPDPGPRIVWPEELRHDLSRNAQELVARCMAAQVQLVMSTAICTPAASDAHVAKTRAALAGSLRWLDENLREAVQVLPEPRVLSWFEVTLFCLVEHLSFRPLTPMGDYVALAQFAGEYGERDAARRTVFRFDE